MSLRLLLLPFSLVYTLAAGLRNTFFNSGIFKETGFRIPVILVGNLSVGGTGKTPHIEYLIRLLQNSFLLATLSRGYGRSSSGFVIAGKGSTAKIIGDEPMQYFTKFNKITVAVCEDRVEGINKLLQLPQKPDVILMDDGFQHRKVKPGFKILLTSADRLFTRDFVLPAGDLRESRMGYKRADCIIVTKTPEQMTAAEKAEIVKEISPLPGQKVFFSSIVYDHPVSFFSNENIPVSLLKNYDVVLFTGIANPGNLINFFKNNSSSIAIHKFPDHHNFTAKDIKSIKEKFDMFAGGKSIIVTTEKDYLRLLGTDVYESLKNLPCYYIPVTVKIDRENEFNEMIEKECREKKDIGH